MSKPPRPNDTPPASRQPSAQEKQARKAQQAQEGAAAWLEYKNREAAMRDRTAELRRQRLAREAKRQEGKKPE